MGKLDNKKLSKEDETLNTLPPELHEVFKQLVDEYKLHCITRHGRAFVSHPILAELIKSGWRPTHEPFVDFKKKTISG